MGGGLCAWALVRVRCAQSRTDTADTAPRTARTGDRVYLSLYPGDTYILRDSQISILGDLSVLEWYIVYTFVSNRIFNRRIPSLLTAGSMARMYVVFSSH